MSPPAAPEEPEDALKEKAGRLVSFMELKLKWNNADEH